MDIKINKGKPTGSERNLERSEKLSEHTEELTQELTALGKALGGVAIEPSLCIEGRAFLKGFREVSFELAGQEYVEEVLAMLWVDGEDGDVHKELFVIKMGEQDAIQVDDWDAVVELIKPCADTIYDRVWEELTKQEKDKSNG